MKKLILNIVIVSVATVFGCMLSGCNNDDSKTVENSDIEVNQTVQEAVEPIKREEETVETGATVPAELPVLSASNKEETILVNAQADVHEISPLIYGLAFADKYTLDEANIPINRWGGNSKTTYNWKTDSENAAKDWYFLNKANDLTDVSKLPHGSSSDVFVETNMSLGAETMMTIPMIGYVSNGRLSSHSYSIEKYGEQTDREFGRGDRGNGIRLDGTRITDNDPLDAYIQVDEKFMQEWVRHLVDKYGTAEQGGVKYYCLDNEPFLWNSTHMDIVRQGLRADELIDLSIKYALAIKEIDPTALIVGPNAWGWLALKETAYDMEYRSENNGIMPDREEKKYDFFAQYYLQRMKEAEEEYGMRLLDVFTTHIYPQGGETDKDKQNLPEINEKRMRSTRSLWDPNYIDESWINTEVKMIPMLKEWVATYYPETQIGITEYNWRNLEKGNGGIAAADILGIFGREGLDIGTMWTNPSRGTPAYNAFKIFRNYDGEKSTFGDQSIHCLSSDPDKVAAYGSLDSKTGEMKIVVLNKHANGNTPFTINIENFSSNGNISVYQWVGETLPINSYDADKTLTDNTLKMVVPPNSATMIVIQP